MEKNDIGHPCLDHNDDNNSYHLWSAHYEPDAILIALSALMYLTFTTAQQSRFSYYKWGNWSWEKSLVQGHKVGGKTRFSSIFEHLFIRDKMYQISQNFKSRLKKLEMHLYFFKYIHKICESKQFTNKCRALLLAPCGRFYFSKPVTTIIPILHAFNVILTLLTSRYGGLGSLPWTLLGLMTNDGMDTINFQDKVTKGS